MSFLITNAVLQSESFNLSIGDPHRVVEMQLTAQVTGPDDCSNGFFINGRSFWPDSPNVVAWGHPLV